MFLLLCKISEAGGSYTKSKKSYKNIFMNIFTFFMCVYSYCVYCITFIKIYYCSCLGLNLKFVYSPSKVFKLYYLTNFVSALLTSSLVLQESLFHEKNWVINK